METTGGEKVTRDEHMQWCKDRALPYVDRGDAAQAVASMCSDLSKHEETAGIGEVMGMMGMLEIQNGDEAVRRWITGFN
jgi:hypothetical protein